MKIHLYISKESRKWGIHSEECSSPTDKHRTMYSSNPVVLANGELFNDFLEWVKNNVQKEDRDSVVTKQIAFEYYEIDL